MNIGMKIGASTPNFDSMPLIVKSPSTTTATNNTISTGTGKCASNSSAPPA
jgi:hypothetical protein